MLSLVGLGLNEHGYSKEAQIAISKADKVYFDSYTIEFPYEISAIEKQFEGKKFIPAGREFVESLSFLKEAKTKNIALVVYGSPLMATTHTVIVKEAREKGIKLDIIQGPSIFDAIAETGLQPYKFGRTTSLPNFPADSYVDSIKQNNEAGNHSLILVDIGMTFENALKRLNEDLKNKKMKISKILVCSRLDLKDGRIFYGEPEKLKSHKILAPFCFVIPGKLHFLEKEFIESFSS